jgi:hypothetical protein
VLSVLEQPGVDPRVIVVDDASPDDSADIARKLAATDPRVEVVVHEENLGHIRTYNEGLALVRTEFAVLLSADDLLTPGALRRATAFMIARPRIGFVYGGAQSFSDSVPQFTPKTAPFTEWSGRNWISLSCRRGRNFIMSPEVVMRTEALHSVGLFSPELPHSADLELWLRLAAQWDVGRVNRVPQAFYRVHQANMHLTTFATLPVDLRHRLAAFEVIGSPWFSSRVPDASGLLVAARRAVAREAILIASRGLDGGAPAELARELFAFAEQTMPGNVRPAQPLTAWRLRRADSGLPPAPVQRHVEAARRQVDRLRWKTWQAVGLS